MSAVDLTDREILNLLCRLNPTDRLVATVVEKLRREQHWRELHRGGTLTQEVRGWG